MNQNSEIIFFSAPGKIRLKPLIKPIIHRNEKKQIVNKYIILYNQY